SSMRQAASTSAICSVAITEMPGTEKWACLSPAVCPIEPSALIVSPSLLGTPWDKYVNSRFREAVKLARNVSAELAQKRQVGLKPEGQPGEIAGDKQDADH